MVPQARGHPRRPGPPEGGQAAARDCPRPGQVFLGGPHHQRGLHELRRHAPGAELGAEPPGPVAAAGPGLDPLARERGVVHVAPVDEVGDDGGGDVGWGPATVEASGQVRRRPRTAREEVGGGQPRAPRVEDGDSPRRYDRRAKGLGGAFPGGAWSAAASSVCSPVEKMPRTLRSKSSGLVAASRAVS
jgi:hypothetical protein